jgi:NhaA family Na+:H+ antiporter
MVNTIREFLKLESAAGFMLVAAAAIALVASNSPLSSAYDSLLSTRLEIRLGDLALAKPLLLWVNEGLMAIFFFLVGLEIKREIVDGELSRPSAVILPVVAALGGMAVPALIYSFFNIGDPVARNGWGIPTATDIAFALGVLSLLGPTVPVALKVFLTAVAVIDDLGAIIIIALFYTGNLSLFMLLGALVLVVALIGMNVAGVTRTAAYVLVGLTLWLFVLKSGVHATLAGVAVAFALPLSGADEKESEDLRSIEHKLHPWVAFGVLPVFGFFNAGVSFAGVTLDTLAEPIPLGIAAGLLVGKLVGIYLSSWLLVKSGKASLPEGAGWIDMAGVALICGIGFTMSLFIGSLALENAGEEYARAVRLGVFAGSIASALLGYAVLRFTQALRASKSSRAVQRARR